MTSRVDTLRSTLDQLVLDPRAREDRPYLISMLRRLGYSEAEIQSVLGETLPPEPKPAAARARGPRVIEVEYTGPDFTKDYQEIGPDGRPVAGGKTQYVIGAGGEQIPVGEDGEMTFSLADDSLTYADGEDFGDFDTSAVDAVDANWSDDWGEGEFGSAMLEREKEMENLSESERRKLLEEMGLDPDDPNIVDFGRRPRPTYLNKPRDASIELLQFEELSVSEAEGRRRDAALDAGWLPVGDEEPVEETGGWSPGGQDAPFAPEEYEPPEQPEPEPPAEEWAPEEPSWPQAEPEPLPETSTDWAGQEKETWPEPEWGEGAATPLGDAFQYKDYTLYTRDVELSTGKPQRIYFFSKNPPKEGEPAPLPDGYEVRENEQTGLPYLSRITVEGRGRGRRVRAVRVSAENRRDAEEQLRREGREVRGSVPIEFEGDEA